MAREQGDGGKKSRQSNPGVRVQVRPGRGAAVGLGVQLACRITLACDVEGCCEVASCHACLRGERCRPVFAGGEDL